MKNIKKILLWVVTGFFALTALIYFPSFSSVFAILVSSIVLPVEKWQEILKKYLKKPIKTILLILFLILTFATVPQENIENDNNNDMTSNSITSSQETTSSNEEDESSNVSSETKDESSENKHEHSFVSATCVEPKTCSSCGEKVGNANGHSWKAATCLAPKTCSVCNKTEGSKTNHAYTNGKCSVCGAKNPEESTSSTVQENTNSQIVYTTKTGKRYHSSKTCSSLSNANAIYESTLSQAKDKGLTPCATCH